MGPGDCGCKLASWPCLPENDVIFARALVEFLLFLQGPLVFHRGSQRNQSVPTEDQRLPQVNDILCRLIIASLVAHASYAFAHNGVVAHARPAAGIVVDGDLSDWPADAPSYPIRTQQIGSAPVDSYDFDGQFRVAWHANGSLWVAVDLVDDETILDGVAPTSLADLRRFFGMLGWRSSGQVETPDLADGCALLIDMGHEDGASRTVRFGLDGRDTKTCSPHPSAMASNGETHRSPQPSLRVAAYMNGKSICTQRFFARRTTLPNCWPPGQ